MLVYPQNISEAKLHKSKKALFLDRDGVINHNTHYLHKIPDFEFIDGIFDLCKAAVLNDFLIIVVTNQSGIGRGYYNENTFLELTKWMIDEFAHRNVKISRVYACPHLADAPIKEYQKDCHARKPNPGMLLQAQKDFDLEMSQCIFIGDNISDMEAGHAAGIHQLYYIKHDGHEEIIPDSGINYVSSLKEIEEQLFM